MKKFIVLTLVVAMASLATAGLTTAIDSPVVTITGDAAVNYAGALGYSEALSATVELAPQVPLTFSGITPYGVMDSSLLGMSVGQGYVYEIAVAGDTSALLPSGDHVIITFADIEGFGPDDMGKGQIEWTNMNTGSVETAFVVPEPMTLGLLGLGGLLLRRKK